MEKPKDAVDAYLETLDRVERTFAPIDQHAAVTSIAISLKRIADSLDYITNKIKEDFPE